MLAVREGDHSAAEGLPLRPVSERDAAEGPPGNTPGEPPGLTARDRPVQRWLEPRLDEDSNLVADGGPHRYQWASAIPLASGSVKATGGNSSRTREESTVTSAAPAAC